ncbi:hypothetical protein QUF58_02530 [Anaerolineales bacterium HSG24]|nr:hypothetical protein [Anaerolineales bacterium HSG24]
MVVNSILTDNYWPENDQEKGQSLIKRLSFYGQETVPPDLKVLVENMTTLPTLGENNPENLVLAEPVVESESSVFGKIFSQIKGVVGMMDIKQEAQKIAAYWAFLLGLELSNDHFHAPGDFHTNCKSHDGYDPHYHPNDSVGQSIPCEEEQSWWKFW